MQGDLGEFGIPDILQLIGNQQKTGILHVGNAAPDVGNLTDAQVYFRSGKVIRCDATRRDKRDLLGNMMLDAGVISRDQLDAGLKNQKQTLRPLGDILLEQEAITPDHLKQFAQLQIHETLLGIFEWKRGTYRFEARPAGFAKPVVEPIPAESLLMEGMRRLDEWPLVRAKISNYGEVYRPLRDIEDIETEADALERILDDAFSETVAAAQAAHKGGARRSGAVGSPASRLGRKERRVLRLVDGEADVHTLVARSRLGEFETCKALLTLLNEGFIAPGKGRAPKEGDTAGARHLDWPRLLVRFAANVAILAALVAIILFIPRDRLQGNAEAVAHTTVSRLRANRILAASAALEVHRIEEGSYPDSLAALPAKGLLDEELLSLPGQAPFEYLSIGVDYDLR